jgi:hypothetical protein
MHDWTLHTINKIISDNFLMCRCHHANLRLGATWSAKHLFLLCNTSWCESPFESNISLRRQPGRAMIYSPLSLCRPWGPWRKTYQQHLLVRRIVIRLIAEVHELHIYLLESFYPFTQMDGWINTGLGIRDCTPGVVRCRPVRRLRRLTQVRWSAVIEYDW